MNRDDLAAQVQSRTGYTSSDDLTAVEGYLQNRDETIFNHALWRDALVAVDATCDPATDDGAEGVVRLPEVIDRVVAVRSSDRSLRVQNAEYYWRVDYDWFSTTGTPYTFQLMSPVWLVWRDGPGFLAFVALSDSDTGKEIKVVWTDEDGVRHTSTGTLDTTGDSFQLATTTDKITVNAVWLEQNTAGVSVGTVANGPELATGVPYSGALALITVEAGKTYYYLAGANESGALNGVSGGVLTSGETFVAAETSVGIYQIGLNPILVTAQLYRTDVFTAIETIATGETSSPSYQRIRLFNIPTVATVLKVLGKAKYVPLDFGQQEPMLRNSADTLIAFACGDICRRGGENGNATMYYQEAQALLKQLKDVESVQAAHNQMLIPESGLATDYPARGRGDFVYW